MLTAPPALWGNPLVHKLCWRHSTVSRKKGKEKKAVKKRRSRNWLSRERGGKCEENHENKIIEEKR